MRALITRAYTVLKAARARAGRLRAVHIAQYVYVLGMFWGGCNPTNPPWIRPCCSIAQFSSLIIARKRDIGCKMGIKCHFHSNRAPFKQRDHFLSLSLAYCLSLSLFLSCIHYSTKNVCHPITFELLPPHPLY